MENISNWFWNDDFWLPKGVSFNDFVPSTDEVYARPRDLLALPVYGLIVYVLRHVYERYISNPLAAMILSSDFKAVENLGKNGHVSTGNGYSNGNSKQLNGKKNSETRLLERKQQKLKKIKDTMAKIAETSWKSLFHSFSFSIGMFIMIQAPWFWDGNYCWSGFPKHPLWPSLYWYYMIEGAYYIALLLCLATDVKRKDRYMMMAHHIGTINLVVFSYATNQTRVGSLLMVLHRFADMLLQIAKLLLYCKCKKIANYLFIVFVTAFLITRLYIYPFYILHTATYKFAKYFRPYGWYCVGTTIAVGLLILHIMWAHIILKMAFKAFTKGPLDKDDRSGTEDESDTETQEANKKQN